VIVLGKLKTILSALQREQDSRVGTVNQYTVTRNMCNGLASGVKKYRTSCSTNFSQFV